MKVLIVVSILAILGALVFAFSRSAKSASRQTVSIANLSAIYRSLLIYGADGDPWADIPELGSVPPQPLRNSRLLLDCGLAPDQLHSAAFPIEGRKRWGSSFTWYWVTGPGNGQPVDKTAKINLERLQVEKDSFVIVQDTVHDYFDYWPNERESDPLMQRRFELNLRVNGSIKKQRRPGIRGVVLPFWL